MSSFHLRTVALLLGLVADGFRMKSKAKDEAKPYDQEAIAKLYAAEAPDEPLESKIILDPKDFPECHLSESDCDMKEMTGATLVYTDTADSRCWNGEPFAFLVHPGATDKLFYYFPSGGACWEFPFYLPGSMNICVPNLWMAVTATGYGSGAMEFNNPANADGFRDYTVVSPPYCTGGAHVANSTLKGLFGTNYQHDYNNNNFAIKWAKHNVDNSLKSFVIGGSSAGSLGAMAWSDTLLSRFTYEKASVFLDSYMGVFPDGTQGPTLQGFEVCDLPIWKDFKTECHAGTSNIQDIFEATIEKYPKVAFAHIQPKADIVQRAFYSAIALTYLRLDLYMGQSRFYELTNEMMQRFSKHPNYVNYFVDGVWHTFSWWGWWYTATVAGQNSRYTKGKPTLVEWVNSFINHEPVKSACNGWLRKNGAWGTDYCDKALYPKTLSVSR